MSSEQNKVILRAEHISKTYGEKKVLEDISIHLEQGELVSLLGVSGSGKTTLFNMLSGIIPPDEGKVYLKDQDVTSTPGSISYMLQKDLLLPHKKVIDNVALPLVLKGVKKAEAREKANPLFAEFGLEGTQYQYPSQLSGGMRQRAALLRTYLSSSGVALLDEPFRKNPTDGVMAELKKNLGMKTGVRHALTIPQQRAFMEYIATHPIYFHWWPIFTIFLGTGCRIGEVLGLRWEDIDYEKRIISINHNLTYYPVGEDRASENHISTPKTEAGMRTIPMLDTVKDAFEMIWEEQKENGWTDAEIDGMTGFVFCNRYGNIMNAQSVNRAIKRISSAYNATEEIEAKKEHREPVLLPDFSAHSLRHTFCTRLCERETNLKIIQSIMGHKDIQTTMDIYAEATEEKKQETFEHLAATMDVF